MKMKPEVAKTIALNMYFELDKRNAISKKWKKKHSLSQLEGVFWDMFAERIDDIQMMERMK